MKSVTGSALTIGSMSSNGSGASAMVAVAGAAGSLGLMLRVGQRSPGILLALFAVWVVSPFVGVALAGRWRVGKRATLYRVGLVLAVGSLAVYGYTAFGPPRAKPAAVFLMVPLVSWVVIGVVAAVGWRGRAASPRRVPEP